MSEQTRTVTIARPEFGYTSRDTAGRRHQRFAYAGETITVSETDYRRGVKWDAFAGTSRNATEVTIEHGLFHYTPVPYPRSRAEGFEETAMRGTKVLVDDEDLERGKRHGAFVEFLPPPPRYGLHGEPPFTGSAIGFLNWLNTATPTHIDTLIQDLWAAAGDNPALRQMATEAQETLNGEAATLRGSSGQDCFLTIHADLVQRLGRQILGIRATIPRGGLEELRDEVARLRAAIQG